MNEEFNQVIKLYHNLYNLSLDDYHKSKYINLQLAQLSPVFNQFIKSIEFNQKEINEETFETIKEMIKLIYESLDLYDSSLSED